MKHQLLTVSLLSVAALATTALRADFVSPNPAQLTDYKNWFDNSKFSFSVSSDLTFFGQPSPLNGTPPAGTYNDGIRNVATWSGWTYSVPTIGSPIKNTNATKSLFVETVYLGETAGWWNDFGYRITKADNTFSDFSLAKDIQSVGKTQTVKFGNFSEIEVKSGETLDFFFTGTGRFGLDGTIFTAPHSADGGKYWLFGSYPNTPLGAKLNAGVGVLDPLYSVRGANFTAQKRGSFTVVGLEDVRDQSLWHHNDKDANDFLFAFRTTFDNGQTEIPEPSTYGLMGAAVLGGLIGYRRFKASRKA